MALIRTRTAFRRLALVIAATQLLAYAAAPVLEAVGERAPGPHTVETAHNGSCVPVHQPASCMACQLLNLTASKTDTCQVPVAREEPGHPADAVASSSVARAPPSANLTRAPPPILA